MSISLLIRRSQIKLSNFDKDLWILNETIAMSFFIHLVSHLHNSITIKTLIRDRRSERWKKWPLPPTRQKTSQTPDSWIKAPMTQRRGISRGPRPTLIQYTWQLCWDLIWKHVTDWPRRAPQITLWHNDTRGIPALADPTGPRPPRRTNRFNAFSPRTGQHHWDFRRDETECHHNVRPCNTRVQELVAIRERWGAHGTPTSVTLSDAPDRYNVFNHWSHSNRELQTTQKQAEKLVSGICTITNLTRCLLTGRRTCGHAPADVHTSA